MARRHGRRRADEVDRAVARFIRQRRVVLGLRQQEAAELVGVTYQQMHKYETGQNRISVGRLHRIAQALGVEVGHLFADVDPACLGGPGPDEAGRGQRRRLLELVHHVASIGDPKHRQALCQLARDLAALGADAASSAQAEWRRPQDETAGSL